MSYRPEAEHELDIAQRHVTRTAEAATNAVTERNNHIRTMVNEGGFTMYRIAQLTGMSQQRIARIMEDSGNPASPYAFTKTLKQSDLDEYQNETAGPAHPEVKRPYAKATIGIDANGIPTLTEYKEPTE